MVADRLSDPASLPPSEGPAPIPTPGDDGYPTHRLDQPVPPPVVLWAAGSARLMGSAYVCLLGVPRRHVGASGVFEARSCGGGPCGIERAGGACQGSRRGCTLGRSRREGTTAAVLAEGIDRFEPRWRDVHPVSDTLVLSEFPPGTLCPSGDAAQHEDRCACGHRGCRRSGAATSPAVTHPSRRPVACPTALIRETEVEAYAACWILDGHWLPDENRRFDVGELVCRTKQYGDRPGDARSADVLAECMAWWADAMGRWADCPVGQIAAVVPVPSHHQSVPHNLPDVLGRAIAERLGLPCLTGLLAGGGSGREKRTLAPRERARAPRHVRNLGDFVIRGSRGRRPL